MADRLHAGYHHEVLRTWQSPDTEVTAASLMYPVFVRLVSRVSCPAAAVVADAVGVSLHSRFCWPPPGLFVT